jgi:hypothetical protein
MAKVNSKGAAMHDDPIFKQGYTVNIGGGRPKEKSPNLSTEGPSPDATEAECKCGIPNCHGHPIINGKIQVVGHPLSRTSQK